MSALFALLILPRFKAVFVPGSAYQIMVGNPASGYVACLQRGPAEMPNRTLRIIGPDGRITTHRSLRRRETCQGIDEFNKPVISTLPSHQASTEDDQLEARFVFGDVVIENRRNTIIAKGRITGRTERSGVSYGYPVKDRAMLVSLAGQKHGRIVVCGGASLSHVSFVPIVYSNALAGETSADLSIASLGNDKIAVFLSAETLPSVIASGLPVLKVHKIPTGYSISRKCLSIIDIRNGHSSPVALVEDVFDPKAYTPHLANTLSLLGKSRVAVSTSDGLYVIDTVL